jgi:MutS domain V
MDALDTFQQRISQYKEAIALIQKQLDQIAWTRLGVFLFAAGLEIASWSWGGAWWLLCAFIGLLMFGVAVRWNERVKTKLKFQQTLLQLNADEISRLEGKLSGFEEGKAFIDPHHPYSSDLDLFGKHSLYQLLNRASTVFGRRRLATWMLGQADVATIQARQETARVLATQLDWRQHLQATGQVEAGEDVSPESIQAWVDAPSLLATMPYLNILPKVMMVLLGADVVLEVIGIVPTPSFLVILFINGIINRRLGKQIKGITAATKGPSQLMSSWVRLIAEIEGLANGGPAFTALQARLQTDGQPASEEIAKLGRILSNLELSSSGAARGLLNNTIFWDLFCLRSLESWKKANGHKILDWLEVIGEAEALSSLAANRFLFATWSDPEVVDGPFLLEAEVMGHPLIPAQQRVSNPMHIAGNGTVWLVTGSNMSGKSTYLRTAGVNVVLALMGASVCATRLRLSPMQVATSMRTIDSLEENTSSFYAELKRLKSVIELVREHDNAFFLLDEILKGTNSRDRQAGARALVQQLHKLGGAGLVSTHDIELVDMAAQMPLAIHNYSFNCIVTPEGQLLFDYKLTDGQCLSMNATALMRAMGIEV